jgi:ATP-dependent RNA helicase RhlE
MTFEELNLSAPVLRAVREAGYTVPSPIQAAAIPPVLAGRDLMGCAQTGTGKTAAFGLPMLDRLAAAEPKKPGAVRALILTPTRELALQIGESFAAYGKYLPLRSTVIFGGVGQAPQVQALRSGVEILVACPGRLNDLIGQGHVDLSGVEIFVLDEADRMLDMGFVHDVKKVIAKLPPRRQNLMFSATMPAEIEQLAAGILHDPAFVKVDPVSSTVDRIRQSLYYVEKGNKKLLLPWLIQNLNDPPVTNALVFSRTKHGADKIARDLVRQGIPAAAIHGNKSQSARVAALEGFKAGKTRVLVATDIAARGIDISELAYVFNYDLPEVAETYVHRIGRTARAGAEGAAVSFCAPEEQEYLAGIEKLNRRKLPVVSGHPWDGAPAPARVLNRPSQTAKAEPTASPRGADQTAAQPVQKLSARAKQPRKEESESMANNKEKRPAPAGAESRRPRRPRREGQAPAQGSNAQPKFDPHFVSAPEATPLRPLKKQPAPQQAAKPQQPAKQPAQSQKQAQPKAEQPAKQSKGQAPAARKPAAEKAQPPRTENRRRGNPRPAEKAQPQSEQPRRTRAPQPEQPPRSARRSRAPQREEDPGLVLISRRPPQQKFTSFEEYMNAHGGATAPIEDYGGDE